MRQFLAGGLMGRAKDDLTTFFEELDELTKRPIDVVLIGGSACVLRGWIDRGTKDVDFLTRAGELKTNWDTVVEKAGLEKRSQISIESY